MPAEVENKQGDDFVFAPTLPRDPTEPPPSRRPVPPSLSQRYEAIRFLGEGGMGTVYRGLDPRLGRTVAVKLLKGMDAELWRRFLAEARAQARIEHENVCRVYEAGQVDGEPYIAMQYIEGEPLSRMKDKLPLEQRVKVMQEISAAVHEAHRLGIIHRDIKPSNVLCEAREDGTVKPYIMDFGLAREVEDQGQTQTGAVLGTPAYMPPEQARGDVRAMDRRSDVYSLGATLYDLIAGHPPFVSDHAWNLLMAVAYEEAPPLGKAKQGVPADLETIVMKCLEREPSRRYESARALSEDLQRYLDGDPIQAKRAFVAYVLWKKAKKHKLLAALLVSLVVGSLALAGVWVRARRQAAEQARLAQQLGEGVKEMELFLRAAYELPVHDVERERDVVRGRLGEIEQRMIAAGKAGEGPGHYALGRGYLALGDPGQAREHLEKALAAGYASADLEYALGRAFGELFRRAVDETKRITNEEERKKKVEELEKALRDPALSHLRAAVLAKIEVPTYAEGLIALYEGKNEDALSKAKEAAEKAPWMYEAKKLEGDALYAEGSKYRHDAAFDYDKMKGYFEPAAKAYEAAAEMGRSDPEVHRAACELWDKMGQAASMAGKPMDAPYDAAEAACARATQSSSRDGKVLAQRALVSTSRVYNRIADGDVTEKDLRAIEDALGIARRSVDAMPNDVVTRYSLAMALRTRTEVLHGLQREATMTDAIVAYERVLEIDPRFTWAFNELGDAFLWQGNNEVLRGERATSSLQSAIRRFDQAIAVDPKFAMPAGRRLHAYKLVIEGEIERGSEANDALKGLFDGVTQLEAMGAGPWLLAFWKARANRFRALHEEAFGRDPQKPLDEAVASIRAFAGERPDDYWFLSELALCHLIEASHAFRTGGAVERPLEAARQAAATAGKGREPLPPDLRIIITRIELLALRSAGKRGELAAESFGVALDTIRPLVSKWDKDPAPYALASEIHALRATFLQEKGGNASDDVERGLSMADSALSKNPHMASALVAKARLLLVRARSVQTKEERAEVGRQAKEAFEAAFRENALLERDYGEGLKEAAALLP